MVQILEVFEHVGSHDRIERPGREFNRPGIEASVARCDGADTRHDD